MTKRNIFGELMEGVAAMKRHREAKQLQGGTGTSPKVDSKLIRDTRKRLRSL